MRFAVTAKYKQLCADFERCSEFAIMDVKDNAIVTELFWNSPPHETGLLPEWLHDEMKVTALITGNMNPETQKRMAEKGILVVTGANDESPRQALESHLSGALVTGACSCDR